MESGGNGEGEGQVSIMQKRTHFDAGLTEAEKQRVEVLLLTVMLSVSISHLVSLSFCLYSSVSVRVYVAASVAASVSASVSSSFTVYVCAPASVSLSFHATSTCQQRC